MSEKFVSGSFGTREEIEKKTKATQKVETFLTLTFVLMRGCLQVSDCKDHYPFDSFSSWSPSSSESQVF